jgi:hypothetical protein
MDLQTLQSKIPNPSNYIIDIGASTGIGSDPVYNFIINPKYTGLCIEGDKDKVEILKTRTAFDVYNGYITPENALELFVQFNVPLRPDILKIDIDGYDIDVLRKILSVYKPSIIVAEINEKIPPPILFEVKYTPTYQWDESHCYGFSIQSAASVLGHSYKIHEIFDLINITCIHHDLCDTIGINKVNDVATLYKNEYILNPSRPFLEWNDDVNHWLDIEDPYELYHDICRYFSINRRSTFNVKTKIKDIDFTVIIAEDTV